MRHVVNRVLRRATGYEVTKAGTGARRAVQAERLLRAPVFILSSIRSGSTLLRVMLGSHSQIFAPHELHLNDVAAKATTWYAEVALKEAGLDEEKLTRLTWDRYLDKMLRDSGKSILVEKTPYDVFIYKRLLATWPDARFVYLLRHPGSIYQSWREARPDMSVAESVADVLRYGDSVEKARQAVSGIDVRYEDLTSDPETQTRRLCEYLGVVWEPGMVEYGARGHTRFKRGVGDWSDKIRSGRPQAGRDLPALDEVPTELHELCRAWGYTDQ